MEVRRNILGYVGLNKALWYLISHFSGIKPKTAVWCVVVVFLFLPLSLFFISMSREFVYLKYVRRFETSS